MYNAQTIYPGLTDMGHIWYKDIRFDGLGYSGLIDGSICPRPLRAPSLKTLHPPLSSTLLHFNPIQ